MKKYEFTGETNEQGLKRIRAVRYVRGGVSEGTIGGWIADESNLSHEGEAWVHEDAWVYHSAKVFDNALVKGEARVYGHALVAENAHVYSRAHVREDARVSGNAAVYGTAVVYGSAQVHGCARVYGHALMGGRTQVYGESQVCGDAWVGDDAHVYGDAEVYGFARVYGDARVEELSHAIYLEGLPSGTVNMFRTEDGYRLSIGCWNGTTDELREMIAGEDWPEADADQRKVRRPQLAALADMIDATVASWDR